MRFRKCAIPGRERPKCGHEGWRYENRIRKDPAIRHERRVFGAGVDAPKGAWQHPTEPGRTIVQVGAETLPHRHLVSEEIYHITEGAGMMTLGKEQFEIKKGDTVRILPGTLYRVKNTSSIPLKILCRWSPAYSHEDTEVAKQVRLNRYPEKRIRPMNLPHMAEATVVRTGFGEPNLMISLVYNSLITGLGGVLVSKRYPRCHGEKRKE